MIKAKDSKDRPLKLFKFLHGLREGSKGLANQEEIAVPNGEFLTQTLFGSMIESSGVPSSYVLLHFVLRNRTQRYSSVANHAYVTLRKDLVPYQEFQQHSERRMMRRTKGRGQSDWVCQGTSHIR